MAKPDWLAIVDDEVVLRLSPIALSQIEQERQQSIADGIEQEIIYRLDSAKLLSVLASSLGIASSRHGAIIVWTYFDDDANLALEQKAQTSPILRTLLSLDGDLTQKICQDILQHPHADRILAAHSYLISQISRQIVTAIADYVAQKTQPIEIAVISFTAAIFWSDLFAVIGKRFNLPIEALNTLTAQSTPIIVTVLVLIVWWLVKDIPVSRAIQRKIKQLFQNLITTLEKQYLQYIAIAAIVISVICSMGLDWISVDPNFQIIVADLKPWTEAYLPIALVSLRKRIAAMLGKVFLRIPFVVKLIFGRFIR
ncbi:hypothetical protein HCU40_05395 [Pseudanabaena biceps]|nr:hypothetical protein [Pseudanabaena biceps]